jgi:hypothetical protein
MPGAHNAAKTHCPQGHPYDEVNTYLMPRGGRSCKQCARERQARKLAENPEYARAQWVKRAIAWKRRNPDRVRIYHEITKLRQYGLTREDYQRMLDAQNGVCGICGGLCSTGKRLGVDHDAATGRVRGLLCGSCNNGIGRFHHSVEKLQAAIRYLTVGPLT